jgi:hypothetical protein
LQAVAGSAVVVVVSAVAHLSIWVRQSELEHASARAALQDPVPNGDEDAELTLLPFRAGAPSANQRAAPTAAQHFALG